MTVVILAALYSAYSIGSFRYYQSGSYDLGIFEQEVQSYAHGHWPTSLIKGPHFRLLGDHFSPAMAVLAPFWRLAPSPLTLLVAQAVCVAAAAWPIVTWGSHVIGRPSAVVIALCYGLSWGVASAIDFDVHEVMLAAPLLAFAAARFAEERLVAAVAWAAPLVLVKEDLGITVAMLGVLVVWRGCRRLGTLVAIAGITATLVEMYVVLPVIARGQGSYTRFITVHSVLHIATPFAKIYLLGLLMIITAGIAVRSPIALLMVPTLTWRLASDQPAYWSVTFQYSLVLMPVAFIAMIDVLRRTPLRERRRWIAATAIIALALLPDFPFRNLPSRLHSSKYYSKVTHALGAIPDGTSVAASNWLGAHLVTHHAVSLFGQAPYTADYLAVDVSPRARLFPLTRRQQRIELAFARGHGYRLISAAAGIDILRNEGSNRYWVGN